MPLVAFLVMIAYVPGIPSGTIAGRWAVMAAGASAVLLTDRRAGIMGPGHWCGVAFLCWAAASLLWSVSPLDTLGALVQLMVLAGIFVIASRADSMETCWVALGWGVALSLPFLILQTYDYHPVWDSARMNFDKTVGLFLARSPMAEIACVAMIAAIGCWRFGLASLLAVCIYLTGDKIGRETYLMIAAAAAVPLFVYGRRVVVPFLTCCAIVGALMLWLGGSGFLRVEIWSVALANVTLLGTGFGTFKFVFPGYEHAHNEILQGLFELGPVSLLLIGVVVHAFRCPGHVVEKSVLSSLLAAAMVWAPFQFPATALAATVAAGFLCGCRDRGLRARPVGRGDGLASLRRAGTDRPAAVRAPLPCWPDLPFGS